MPAPTFRGRDRDEPSAVSLAVRQAAHFDRSALSLRAGLVAAIPVAGVLAAGTIAGDTVAAVTMGAGALLVGIAWRAGGGTPPVATMATDAAVMGLSTFAGSASGHVVWLHLALLVVWSFTAGLIVAVGRRSAAVGTQAIIAFVVFGRFSQPLAGAAGLAGLVLAGGAGQVLFSALFGAPPALRVQRSAVAEAYGRLALIASDPDVPTGVAAAALDEAEHALAVPMVLGDGASMPLSALLGEGRRMRLEFSALSLLLAQYARAHAGADTAVHRATARVRVRSADALRCIAAVVQATAPLERVRSSLAELDAAAEELATTARAEEAQSGRPDARARGTPDAGRRGGTDARARGTPDAGRRGGTDSLASPLAEPIGHHAAALAGQIRAAAGLAAGVHEGRGRITVRPSLGSWSPWRQLVADFDQVRANASLRSPAGRHAVRLAVIVPATEVLSQHIPLQRGYWIVVAAATVLRPDFGATFTRGAERMAGTTAGVILAGLLAVAVHPAGWATVALVGILAWAAYTVFPASYAAGVAFLSAMIVFLLEAVAPSTLATATDRGIDTIVGGTIGLIGYALWPTWSSIPARQALADLATAQRDYIRAVLAMALDGRPAAEQELRPLARRARMGWTRAEATIERSLSEPAARRIDVEQARRVMTGLRRLVQAAHVTRLELEDGEQDRPLPTLRPLAEAVDQTLSAIAETLGAGAPTKTELPPLRALYHDLVAGDAGAELDGVLLTELDEMIDAANTIAAQLGLA